MRTAKTWLFIAALLIPGAAQAAPPAAFAQLRDRAQALPGLSTFLSSFIGDCGFNPLGGGACKKKVEAFRRGALGKTYQVILDDDAQRLVQPRGFSPSTHEMEFALTPYFEAAGFALTHGQPHKLNAQGSPVIPLIRMNSILGDAVTPMMVDRVFRTGDVRMQIVFKPLGIWKLPRKDKRGAFVEGVKAQILAVRLTEARTGSTIAYWVSK